MLEQTTRNSYNAIFGTKPELIVRAPGRINLIGEHVDYNLGFVLPAAIDKAIWLAMGKRSDNELHFHALDLQDSYQGEVSSIKKSEQNWANYLLGVISEAQIDGLEIGGVNVVLCGEIPLGAGLSSSAALESGMLAGLNELFKLGLSKMDIVKLAQRGENNFVGMNCGIMDMFASVMGQANQVLRLDCLSLDFEYFPFDAPDHALVLCDSGVKHALVDSEYNLRREECEAGLRFFKNRYPGITSFRDLSYPQVLATESQIPPNIFKRSSFVVEELVRVDEACKALKKKDLQRFGLLMLACHEGLHNEYEVTCAETDFLVRQAMLHDEVLGARQMGGGFGGCTLNLIKRDAVADFIEEMTTAYLAKFGLRLNCHLVLLEDGVEVRQ